VAYSEELISDVHILSVKFFLAEKKVKSRSERRCAGAVGFVNAPDCSSHHPQQIKTMNRYEFQRLLRDDNEAVLAKVRAQIIDHILSKDNTTTKFSLTFPVDYYVYMPELCKDLEPRFRGVFWTYDQDKGECYLKLAADYPRVDKRNEDCYVAMPYVDEQLQKKRSFKWQK